MSPQRAITFINLRFYAAVIALIGAPFLAATQPDAQVLADESAEPPATNIIHGYSPEPLVCQNVVSTEVARGVEWRRSTTRPSI